MSHEFFSVATEKGFTFFLHCACLYTRFCWIIQDVCHCSMKFSVSRHIPNTTHKYKCCLFNFLFRFQHEREFVGFSHILATGERPTIFFFSFHLNAFNRSVVWIRLDQLFLTSIVAVFKTQTNEGNEQIFSARKYIFDFIFIMLFLVGFILVIFFFLKWLNK